jgi:hypothetical protein
MAGAMGRVVMGLEYIEFGSAFRLSLLFIGLTFALIVFVRPILQFWLRRQGGINEIVGVAISSFSVFYGILLGLLAVAAYQNVGEAKTTVKSETTAIAALHRNLAHYPEPLRTDAQRLLVTYTRHIIDNVWPKQSLGIVERKSDDILSALQDNLQLFDPETETQSLIHGETMSRFYALTEAKALREAQVKVRIDGVLWWLVVVGAGVNIVLLVLLDVRLFVHLLVAGLVMFYLSMTIYAVSALDEPFAGAVQITPDDYQAVLQRIAPGG